VVTTVKVTCLARGQDGSPVPGAIVNAKLSGVEVDSAAGYVLPKQVTAIADASDIAVLSLWPNQLGSTATFYEVKITNPVTGKTVRVDATIPNADCQLHLVANLPPYEGKPDGQLAVDAAAQSANSANAAALTAVAARDATQALLASPLALTNQTTTTTVGTAGAAAPLPATPLGYWTTTFNGIAVKIPFYKAE
jgi:hypothetical protein